MLKIGLFSKLSRVSIRMLRYYDEMGLLRPAYIDPDSDYRYYREDQLQTVGWITALRDMGFSLADVRRMSQLGRDAEALAPFFAARRRELQAETAKTAQQLLLLDTAEKRLGKEDFMQYNITIKTIPARYAACVHTVIPRYQDEGQVWQTLCAETDHMHLVPDDPCYCAVTFLDGEFKETDVELEAWKTVKGTYPDTPHVKFRTLPAVTVASCIFRGPYSGIGEVYAALAAWIEANGYEYDGPMFNIYHVSPHETQDPPNLRHRSLLPGTEEVSARLYKKHRHKRCSLTSSDCTFCLRQIFKDNCSQIRCLAQSFLLQEKRLSCWRHTAAADLRKTIPRELCTSALCNEAFSAARKWMETQLFGGKKSFWLILGGGYAIINYKYNGVCTLRLSDREGRTQHRLLDNFLWNLHSKL